MFPCGAWFVYTGRRGCCQRTSCSRTRTASRPPSRTDSSSRQWRSSSGLADRVHLTPRLTGRMGGLTWIVSAHSVSHCPLDVVNNRVAVGVRCDVLTQLWPPDREKVLPDNPGPAVPAQRLRLVLRGAPRAGHGDLQTVIAELGPGLASRQSGEAFVFIYLGTTWNSSSDPERCLGTERLADRRTPSIIYWNIFGPVIFLF